MVYEIMSACDGVKLYNKQHLGKDLGSVQK